tara:strand:- start:266 stop:430 length:165 start_codon:yes stop_codon:yes gene_type:complete
MKYTLVVAALLGLVTFNSGWTKAVSTIQRPGNNMYNQISESDSDSDSDSDDENV